MKTLNNKINPATMSNLFFGKHLVAITLIGHFNEEQVKQLMAIDEAPSRVLNGNDYVELSWGAGTRVNVFKDELTEEDKIKTIKMAKELFDSIGNSNKFGL